MECNWNKKKFDERANFENAGNNTIERSRGFEQTEKKKRVRRTE